MINKLIEKLSLPELLSKDRMFEILQNEEYGFIPAKPEKLSFEVEEDIEFDRNQPLLNELTKREDI